MGAITHGLLAAATETEIARRLRDGQQVLLVGARPSNLPHALSKHPQLILWTDVGDAPRTVPANARVVLFTKWIGHTVYRTIRDDAQRDANRVVWPELLGTGEIRRLLRPLTEPAPVEAQLLRNDGGSLPAYTPPVMVAAPAATCDCGHIAGDLWSGSTRGFVEVHWRDDDRELGWQTREAKRLHLLAAQHGLQASLHYIESLVSQLSIARRSERDEETLSRERAERAAAVRELNGRHAALEPGTLAPDPPPAPQPIPDPPPAPPAPVTRATVTASEQRISADLAELLRMIGDAQAVLGLARETVEQLAQENQQLRGARDALRNRIAAALDESI